MDVYEFLKQNNISYEKYDHPAVFTAEEAKTLAAHVPGQQTKNLFLCDDKKKRFYLVTIMDEKRANLKHLGEFLGEKSLRFAPIDKLLEYLGITPGSVSILGLINDINHAVSFSIDEDLLKLDKIYVHPNINTATLAISIEDFKKILSITGHEIKIYKTS
jgi:Ala-tRNA(Pro) deacylase